MTYDAVHKDDMAGNTILFHYFHGLPSADAQSQHVNVENSSPFLSVAICQKKKVITKYLTEKLHKP